MWTDQFVPFQCSSSNVEVVLPPTLSCPTALHAPPDAQVEVSRPEPWLSAFVAGLGGWTLDAFDFFLVVLSLTAIGQQFGQDIKHVTLALTATLALRPVGAFLFPQTTLTPETRRIMGEDTWSPGFVDYLFLAFNTSTAFSPTDVPVLSRWAKVMMMIQSLISLATIALLAARAVNIL